MAAADFIPQSDPYSTPSGFTPTTTPGGGSAFNDAQGNMYTRTENGFQLFKPPQAVNSGLTAVANNTTGAATNPAPTVVTSQSAKDAITAAQTSLQGELARIGANNNTPEGGQVNLNGQNYTRMPDGSYAPVNPAGGTGSGTSGSGSGTSSGVSGGSTGAGSGATTVSPTGLKANQYGFYRDPGTGAVTFYDSQGNQYGTNPLGGDQYKNNPEDDPNFAKGSLIKLANPPTGGNGGAGTTQSTGNPALDAAVKSYQDKIAQFSTDSDDIVAKLGSLTSGLDTANANLIAGITATFQSSIAATQKVNDATLKGLTQSGIRSGRNIYAPEIEAGNIMEEMNAGIQRIQDLQSQRDQLIAQAQVANTKEEYSELYQTWGLAQKNFEDQGKAVSDLYDKTIAFNKAATDNAKSALDNLKTQQDLDKNTIDSISHLALNSLTGDATKDAETVKTLAAQYGVDPGALMSAVQALHDDNKQYTGDTGSYQFYAEQERSAGRTPVDYLTFLADVKAGISPNGSGASGSGTGAGSGNNNPAGKIINGYDLRTYATDPNYGTKVDGVLQKLPSISDAASAQAYINSVAPNSPITGDMVMAAAMKYNIDPQVLMSMMQVESQFGTQGAAVPTMNVGNIGNVDNGNTQKMASWNAGVDAMAANIAGRRTVAANPDDQPIVDSLTDAAKGLLGGVLDYTVDPSKATNLRTADRTKLIAAAQAIDPSYDPRQFDARSALIKDWTAGATRTAINSMNTVTGHLASLANAVAELNNGAIPGINWATNVIGGAAGDKSIQKGVTDFNTTADAVVSELSKIYKGTGSSDLTEILNMRKNISQDSSPTEQKAFIDKSAELMFSRLSALQDNYKAVMGTDPTIQILTPHSIAALNALGIDTSSVAGSSSQGGDQNVVVISPSGQTGSIPGSRLQEYLANGYKQQS